LGGKSEKNFYTLVISPNVALIGKLGASLESTIEIMQDWTLSSRDSCDFGMCRLQNTYQ